MIKPVCLLLIASLSFCQRDDDRRGDLRLSEVFSDVRVRRLCIAAKVGDIKKIDRLLNDGVDVNTAGYHGITPLCWAVWSGSLSGAEHLLKRGASPNVSPINSSSTMNAATANPNMLMLLIEYGGDVNLPGKSMFGDAPLHGAVLEKNIESMRILIEHGADIDVRDNRGRTPLLLACILLDFEQALALFELGADWTVTIPAKSGVVSVWTEIERGKNVPLREANQRALDEFEAKLKSELRNHDAVSSRYEWQRA